MYVVIMVQSFDIDTVLFGKDEYDKAKAYLHWLWEYTYNEALEEGQELNEEQCFHEEDYAKIMWADDDEDTIEFILTYTSEPNPEFKDINWKKYL